MKQLQELFALPENPKIATKFNGITFYTSDRLKERFIKALSKSDYLEPVISEIYDLVKDNRIVPCWQTKSAIKIIVRKILQSVQGDGFASIYEPTEKKIFIILDNYINWFLMYPNKVLSRLVRHELVHYCENKNPDKFLSIFKDYIRDFYVLFFKDIFKIPNKEKIDDEVWKIVSFMYFNFKTENTIASIINQYEKVFSPLKRFSQSPEQFDKTVEDIKQVVKIMLVFGGRSINILFSGYMHVLEPLHRAYNSLGIPIYGNLCSQELYSPAEVIALHVEKKILKNKFIAMMKSCT